MKPVIILPKDQMSKEDIAELRANDICVVEADNPEEVRFAEPPPGDYGPQEQAAIQLFRYVASQGSNVNFGKQRLVELYVNFLLKGSHMEPIKPVTKTKK